MATHPREPRPVERMIFFTDAVAAIAMTLLILPLLEAVTEAARKGLDTIEFLYEDDGQLASFTLSFFIISLFWHGHDRLLARVEYQDGWIFWLNALWMFSIVFLPVATAMVGAMETDPLQLALYIGTMLVTSLIMGALMLVMLRKPQLLSHGLRFAAIWHRRWPTASSSHWLSCLPSRSPGSSSGASWHFH